MRDIPIALQNLMKAPINSIKFSKNIPQTHKEKEIIVSKVLPTTMIYQKQLQSAYTIIYNSIVRMRLDLKAHIISGFIEV